MTRDESIEMANAILETRVETYNDALDSAIKAINKLRLPPEDLERMKKEVIENIDERI